MKFLLLISMLQTAAAAIPAVNIAAESTLGKNLMNHARKLEQEDEMDWEEEFSWISSYSVKFQGCHNIKQWNEEADGEEDVRISTTSLVRFRLCPSESCSATKAAGCASGYADYVIDMPTFMENYFEAVRENTEVACENFLNNQCNCEDGDDQDDNFDAEYCEYDCFNDAEMYDCIDRNPYNDDEEEREFELEEYMECKEIEIPNDERRRRKLEDGEEEEVQYFVGPYCANQGGAIYLGVFTEDTCSELAEIDFEETFGYDLPYSSESIVKAECVTCVEPVNEEDQNDNNNNNGDAEDADVIMESCENLYKRSGKCETNLPSGMMSSINENACNYMDGIRIVRQDGIIDTGSSRPSALATAFIVIFAMAFAAMVFYVWYLRTRLGVKKNSLL